MILKFIWKWLYCSWVHRKHHCFPVVWDREISYDLGIKHDPNYWHCRKCHPCNEGLDKLKK